MHLGDGPAILGKKGTLNESDPKFYSVSISGDKKTFLQGLKFARERNLSHPWAITINMRTGQVFIGDGDKGHEGMNQINPIPKESYCIGIVHIDEKNDSLDLSHVFDLRGEKGRVLEDLAIKNAITETLKTWLLQLGKSEA